MLSVLIVNILEVIRIKKQRRVTWVGFVSALLPKPKYHWNRNNLFLGLDEVNKSEMQIILSLNNLDFWSYRHCSVALILVLSSYYSDGMKPLTFQPHLFSSRMMHTWASLQKFDLWILGSVSFKHSVFIRINYFCWYAWFAFGFKLLLAQIKLDPTARHRRLALCTRPVFQWKRGSIPDANHCHREK